MKTGLIMEGGAMRGMFTAGVIDVLMEAGVCFDGAIGVSAGAVFGCNYKSRQIGRVIRYNKAYCQDPRYVSFRSLLRTGDIYGEEFCYHELPDRLDPFDVKTYEENPMDFYVVCTDVETGKPVYHNCLKGDAEDIQWMRASASMPALSRFVNLDGHMLSDGGTADSIPVRFFESIGYERNVVILTQPE
ncbi:MAG: patatin family protein, partial [Blautia sp.]